MNTERELFRDLESRRYSHTDANYEIELLLEIYNSEEEQRHYIKHLDCYEQKKVAYCCDEWDDCRQSNFNELISCGLIEGSNVYTYDSGGLQYYFLTEKGESFIKRYLNERDNQGKVETS